VLKHRRSSGLFRVIYQVLNHAVMHISRWATN